MGVHARDVLAELLGMGEDEVAALVRAGVLVTERGIPDLG